MYYIEYVDIGNSRDFAVYKQNVTDEISMEDCIRLFEECRGKGILENESFEEDRWYGYDPNNDVRVAFDFNMMATRDVILRVKKYIIVKFGLCHAAMQSVNINMCYIKKMLSITHMLKMGYESDFADYIKEHNNSAESCRDFLSFTTLENAASYYKAIEGIQRDAKRPRDIPDYESIILIDMIFKDYMGHCGFASRVRYYPLFIWWLLSTIIPLRPTEVLMLKRDCIYKRDNKFYIHIDRIKNGGGRKKYAVPVMKEFQIPKEIYQFLDDYRDYVDSLDSGPYLIPYQLYVQKTQKAEGRKRERINTRHFSRLLDSFLAEIVEGQYQYVVVPVGSRTDDNQIERIRMGDTRHLAFINMLMQGLNPLYIQRIGGHHKLEEQLHYCSHLEKFSTAKAYVLSKMLKNRILEDSVGARDWAVEETRKEMLGLDFYSLPKVKNGAGRCTSVNVPNDCICDECLFCQHFIPEKDVAQDYIREMRSRNEKNIAIKKKALGFLLKDALKNEKDIDVVSKNLASLINQKLIIDAYIMNTEKGEIST